MKDYWKYKHRALTTLNELHQAFKEAEATRSLTLYERIDDVLVREELENPEFVPTAKRHGLRLWRSDPNDEWPVLLNRHNRYASSWDIPVFGRMRKKKS